MVVPGMKIGIARLQCIGITGNNVIQFLLGFSKFLLIHIEFCQKCLAETGDIIDAAFEQIAKSDTNAVMIIGDVTNDGEKVSHIEFREKLEKLAKSKPVYTITSTHDWCCDENPRSFHGGLVNHNVETLKSTELRDFYFDFGPKQAISEYITHIGTTSYVIQLSDNVRLLALNDDKNGNDHAGFTEEHFVGLKVKSKRLMTTTA